MSDEGCDYTRADKLIEQVQLAMKDLCVECRKDFAEILAVEAVIWGSENFYEAIGILENAKAEYKRSWEEVINEDDGNNNNETNEKRKIIKL